MFELFPAMASLASFAFLAMAFVINRRFYGAVLIMFGRGAVGSEPPPTARLSDLRAGVVARFERRRRRTVVAPTSRLPDEPAAPIQLTAAVGCPSPMGVLESAVVLILLIPNRQFHPDIRPVSDIDPLLFRRAETFPS